MVKVRAFGLNHSEKVLRTLEIEESYIKKPVIPGIECVGEVADPGDTRFIKGQKVCALMDEIFAFLNAHDLQPRVGQVFDLAHIRDAVAAQDSRKVNGKVVVTVYRGASHRRSAPEYGAAHGALRSARYAAGSAPGAGLLPLRGTLPLCHADLQTGNAGGNGRLPLLAAASHGPQGRFIGRRRKRLTHSFK